MPTESNENTESLRKLVQDVLRSSKGLSNDDVIAFIRKNHQSVLDRSRSYIERIGLVKIISYVTDRRRSTSVYDQNQIEMFDVPAPSFITLTILEDGKPKRIRKDFLDATLEEAEKALEPTMPRVSNTDRHARARSFIEKMRPYLTSPDMTFRDAIARLRKRDSSKE